MLDRLILNKQVVMFVNVYLDKSSELRVVLSSAEGLRLRGADLAALHRGQALRDAQRALAGALPPALEHLLDLPRGLTDDAVLVRLLNLS